MESSRQKLQPNPRDDTNFFSKIFFIWTIPLFKKGYSKILQMEDMFRPLNCDRSDSMGDRLERQVLAIVAHWLSIVFDKIRNSKIECIKWLHRRETSHKLNKTRPNIFYCHNKTIIKCPQRLFRLPYTCDVKSRINSQVGAELFMYVWNDSKVFIQLRSDVVSIGFESVPFDECFCVLMCSWLSAACSSQAIIVYIRHCQYDNEPRSIQFQNKNDEIQWYCSFE